MINAALVLEGGALRSVYSAGVLDSFLENDIEFSYIVGVSAGALNAGNYVSKQIGRSARVNIDYVDDKRYIGFRRLIKEGSIFNFDFLFGEPSKEWMPYDEQAFLNSQQRYLIGATDCLTGEQVFFEKHNYKELTEVLTASSTLPVLSKLTYIENRPYIDGGVAEAVPYKKALEDGYDKIIIVLTRPEGYKEKKNMLYQFLYHICYRKYPKLINQLCSMSTRYNNLLEEIEELQRNGKVFVIRPQKKIKVKRVEQDKSKLRSLYLLGRNEGSMAIQGMLEYIKRK